MFLLVDISELTMKYQSSTHRYKCKVPIFRHKCDSKMIREGEKERERGRGAYNSYLASVQTSLSMNLGMTRAAFSNRATTTMLHTYERNQQL